MSWDGNGHKATGLVLTVDELYALKTLLDQATTAQLRNLHTAEDFVAFTNVRNRIDRLVLEHEASRR